MIDKDNRLPVTRQCQLLNLNRSSVYYQRAPVSDEELALMRRIDEMHLQRPFYGSRRIRDWLQDEGHPVNRKRVRRLMRLMGITALYPKPRTSKPGKGHKIYPYLLRSLTIDHPNQVTSKKFSCRYTFNYLHHIARRHSWHSSNYHMEMIFGYF